MGNGILTNLIISLLFVGLIVSVFMGFMSHGIAQYGAKDYNATNLETYNKVNQLNTLVNNTSNEIGFLKQNPNTNFLEAIGGFLTAGVNGVKAAFLSIGIFTSMASDASDQLILDDSTASSHTFFTVAVSIMTILLISVLIYIFTKVKP